MKKKILLLVVLLVVTFVENSHSVRSAKVINVTDEIYDGTIVMGNAYGSDSIVVLMSPVDEPYSRKFYPELKKAIAKMSSLKIYIKLYPWGSKSTENYKTILCEDSLSLLEKYYNGEDVGKPSCTSTELDGNVKFMKANNIGGLPSVIFSDGTVSGGYRSAEQLLSEINSKVEINNDVKFVEKKKSKAKTKTKTASSDLELAFWNDIKDSSDPDMFRAYIDQYPNGSFSALAKVKMKKYSQKANIEKATLVLMPIKTTGIASDMRSSMESAVVEGLNNKYKVYAGSQVRKKVKEIFTKESENTKAGKKCDETKCMQDIAIAFNCELIATSRVIKNQGGFVLSIDVRNIFDDVSVYSKSVPCKNCDEFQAIEKLKTLVK